MKQLIITVILVAAGSLIGKVSVNYFFYKNNSFDKAIMQAASELNKSCPLMVDGVTRLDNAVALTDNVLQYNYTLVNITKDQIDVEQMKKNMTPVIMNNIKTNPALKVFRDNRVTMAYTYSDKKGVFIFSMKFKYDDYSK